jgi:hypothetical protein
MTKQEVLDQCKIEGNVVYLPDVQLERSLYMEVNKALQGIGGKWNRKEQGFVFPSDPAVLLGRVQEGEKINLKKDFQFFRTPDELADQLVELAELPDNCDSSDFWILEPSAGDGAIIKAIHREHGPITIDACELMEQNRAILSVIKGVRLHMEPDFFKLNILSEDLFTESLSFSYDRIIANPPFTNNQDIDHVYKMWDCLRPGGRIVSVMSNHWRISENKKELTFKRWLISKHADVKDIPEGTFKESGTNIATCIVIIDKP